MDVQAFDNKLKIGKKGSAWASRGEGVGAWILATFSRPVKIVKLKVGLLSLQKSKVSVHESWSDPTKTQSVGGKQASFS